MGSPKFYPIIPATACHQRNYVERYSRYSKLWGIDKIEILWGQPPAGRNPLWLGTSYGGTRPGGETNGDHLSRCASGLQWAQTLGRPVSAGGRRASSTRRRACATRPHVSHERHLHAADGPSGLEGAASAGLSRGTIALTQYHGRRPQSDGVSVAQGGQGEAPKEAQRDRRDLRQYQKKDDQAVSSGSVKRWSIDGKAIVKIGEFSRGGLTRGDNRASDHDRGCKEKYVPCGIVDEESAELTITFGSSYKTSDFIVDVIEAKWEAMAEQEKAATSQLQINMDNGPESSGRRTQFLHRMVQLADAIHKPIQLVYYPPYHSKYNPIERCWGILELHWNGTKLIDAETMLEWAKKMTWKGLHPVVKLSRKVYNKGISLGKAAMQAVEARLKRHPALPKYDILINPAPTS